MNIYTFSELVSEIQIQFRFVRDPKFINFKQFDKSILVVDNSKSLFNFDKLKNKIMPDATDLRLVASPTEKLLSLRPYIHSMHLLTVPDHDHLLIKTVSREPIKKDDYIQVHKTLGLLVKPQDGQISVLAPGELFGYLDT